MARLDELRLMAKVARLYYRDGLRPVTAALPDLPMPERTVPAHQALLRG